MEEIFFKYDNDLLVDMDRLQATSPYFKSEMMKAIIKASSYANKKKGKTQLEFCFDLTKYINHQIVKLSDEVYNGEKNG